MKSTPSIDHQRKGAHTSRITPYRLEYEIDKGRVVHSEAFRRLQSKTQVLQVSESDFHRNRLTHSVEVAQIGKGIARYINWRYENELAQNGIAIDYDLIETICLAHDLGHPPFGHGGEIALNYMMSQRGGFEGNAQTLRIVSKLGKYTEHDGMNLTRRTLLGILKYPCAYSQLWNAKIERVSPQRFENLNQYDWLPPKCYFDEEQAVIDWLFSVFTQNDRDLFQSIQVHENSHFQSIYKSLDCSIMDCADKISYAIHDFEDGLELGIFEHDKLTQVLERIFSNQSFDAHLKETLQLSESERKALHGLKNMKRFISICIGYMVSNTGLVKRSQRFESALFGYEVVLNQDAQTVLDYFKQFVWDNVILAPHSQQLVKNGQIIICHLYEVFLHNPQLLPIRTQQKLNQEVSEHRVIADYISGMTDRYATKMYEKIFGSKMISFFEK